MMNLGTGWFRRTWWVWWPVGWFRTFVAKVLMLLADNDFIMYNNSLIAFVG